MRGQHDGGFARRGEHVEAGIVHPLLDDGEAESAQVLREPASGLGLAAGRRVDVDQGARQTDDVNASRASRASRISRASRGRASLAGGRHRIHCLSRSLNMLRKLQRRGFLNGKLDLHTVIS